MTSDDFEMAKTKLEIRDSASLTAQIVGANTLALDQPDVKPTISGDTMRPWIRTKARGKVQCEQCREWFDNDGLAVPEAHRCLGLPANVLATCEHCTKPETTQAAFAIHECPSRPGESKKLAQCAQCKTWVANNKGNTNKHINRCSGLDITHTHLCPTCGGTFGTMRQKDVHVSSGCPGLHPEAVIFFDPIRCERCWEAFETLVEYRAHEETQHPEDEERPFVCINCGKSFTKKFIRDNIHMEICGVQWSERNNHRCSKCNQGFSNLYKRNAHQKACKPFLCRECRTAYESAQERDQHQMLCIVVTSTPMHLLPETCRGHFPDTGSSQAQAALAAATPTLGGHGVPTTDMRINANNGVTWPYNHVGGSGADVSPPYPCLLDQGDAAGHAKHELELASNAVRHQPALDASRPGDELANRIVQALFYHRLKRGGVEGHQPSRRDSSSEVSPQDFSVAFAKAASESLSIYEVEELISSLQQRHEANEVPTDLHRLVDQRLQRFYTEETGLSGGPRERLASPSGRPDAELGLVMHSQTKDGLIAGFWDEKNQTISALKTKGLSPEFIFGFDLHWRAGLPGRENRGCPAAKWPPALRLLHDNLTAELLDSLPFHLLLVAGSCPTRFHRRLTEECSLLRIHLAPSVEIDMTIQLRPGKPCRITTYIPHPAHVLYNKATSSSSCAVLDSVISFYLWLLNKTYTRGTFTRLAAEIPSGMPNGAPLHRLSAYRVEEKSLGRNLQEDEYERPFWIWAAKFLEEDPADILIRGESVAEAINNRMNCLRHKGHSKNFKAEK